ncbi:putative membrane protein, partial [Chlamydia psittaci 06-1683]
MFHVLLLAFFDVRGVFLCSFFQFGALFFFFF